MSNYVKSVVFDMINYLHQKWMKVDQPIVDVFVISYGKYGHFTS